MPKIRWTDLPPSLRQHLFDRVAERQIAADDLYKLKLWRESDPEARDSPAHGAQRLRDGFDIEEVVAEYNILRGVIYSLAEEQGIPITGRAFHIMNRLLDQAIGLAVQTYAAQRSLDAKRRRDEHLAFVAHDLRTPLNAISLVVRILERDAAGHAAQREDQERMLRTLRRNVDALQRLVTSVVEENTNLPEIAELRLERQDLELWPLVEALLDDLGPVATTSGTELINMVPDEIIVYADASLLRRVLQNLIANAIRATPRGHVIVGARSLGARGSVECFVKDDGAGIAAEQLQRLVEVFDRQEVEQSPPSGLGLGIVNRFVRAHGGKVGVESQKGAGSTFRFTLPGAGVGGV